MTRLRRRMREDRPLRGLSPRTQPCARDAVKHLAQHDRRAPAHRSEEAHRPYGLDGLKEQPVAERTCRIHRDGIRFCCERPRQRPWPVFALSRPRPRPTRPVVLSPPEVRSRLAVGHRATARMGLPLISAWGLRLREGTPRQVADSAPQRLLVRVRQGQGGKDRVVPLAERTRERWRVSWPRARPRPWVCPARDHQTPLPATTRQQTLTLVVRPSGLATDASMHTLRHASATPRRERGVSWRVRQALLGHTRPRTTARDTPLTRQPFAVVHATSHALMADRSPRWGTGRPAVADVCRSDGPASQERVGADLRPRHRRARDELIHCRPEVVGGPLWPGAHGGQEPSADHACRTRRGPTGPQHDPEGWLAERRQARRPVPSVPVVCTRPQALRELVRRHHKDLDARVLRAAAQARIQLAADPHDVGGLLGGLGVLPPWPRPLVDPPQGHGLGPAGGVSADRTAWRPARPSALVPVQARATRFRGRFCALVRQERPDLPRPEVVWTTGGGVSWKPPTPGRAHVLKSLGRDVHRIALPTPRLLSSAEGPVGCRSQDAESPRWTTMTRPAPACLRRLWPQVWPQGFHTVRDEGVWRPVHRPLRHQLQRCLAGYAPDPPPPAPAPTPPATDAWCPPCRAGPRCPCGGQGLLVVIRLLPPDPRGPP